MSKTKEIPGPLSAGVPPHEELREPYKQEVWRRSNQRTHAVDAEKKLEEASKRAVDMEEEVIQLQKDRPVGVPLSQLVKEHPVTYGTLLLALIPSP
jgi:hypothetical protein